MSRRDEPQSQPDDSQQQPQIVVDDPEDFAKTRQLRSIFDARDSYVDARRDANAEYEDGEKSFANKNRKIYRAVQNFAIAVEPLIHQHDADIWTNKTYKLEQWARDDDVKSLDAAKAYWRRHDPDVLDALADDSGGSRLGTHSHGRSKEDVRIIWGASNTTVEFSGVREIVDHIPRLKYLKSHKKGIGKSPPPQRLSDEVFRDLQGFIDDVGLGFDIENTQQTKIDDELLQEVDEWRRRNI